MQGTSRYFQVVDVDGIHFSFSNYATVNASPETLAQAWAEGYDQDTTDLDYRKQNARYWYDYFTGPDAPQPIPEPEPEPYTIQTFSPWMIPVLMNKKKGMKRPCRIL